VKVSLIAAVAENGVIGRDNDLPWKIRDDMRFFVQTTRGHVVITGRLNYEAMGRPLPGRRNIVVTRDASFVAPGCETTTSIEEALARAEEGGENEAFIIGGAQIYRLALPYAHRFYRTRVLSEVRGDVVFPQFEDTGWHVNEVQRGEANSENEHPFVIELLERREAPPSYRKGVS
jgi:dihydrofolate reductase